MLQLYAEYSPLRVWLSGPRQAKRNSGYRYKKGVIT